jgi:hypothetical protein
MRESVVRQAIERTARALPGEASEAGSTAGRDVKVRPTFLRLPRAPRASVRGGAA